MAKGNALTEIDGYKTGHPDQYPKGTEYIYSNFTARSGTHSNVPESKGIVFVGLQLFIKDVLIDLWNETFFSQDKDKVIKKFKRRLSSYLGYEFNTKRMEELHDLGYLPVRIKALPEGSTIPYKVPMLTIVNTHPKFFWVTNMLECVMSCELWPMICSATTYREYLKVFYQYSDKTGVDRSFAHFQTHDFSYRGMFGREAAAKSSLATLLAGSLGSDTIRGIDLAEDYYGADCDEEFIAGSVNATEHSVMSSSIEVLVLEGMSRVDAEMLVFERLLTETYPEGILSIVSDTFDFWQVVTNILPRLKQVILNRNGKLVIRPDSGDPVKIICGDFNYVDYDQLEDNKTEFLNLAALEGYLIEEKYERNDYENGYRDQTEIDLEYFKFKGKYYKFEQRSSYSYWDHGYGESGSTMHGKEHTIEEYQRTPEQKGLVECLWEIFGGTVNEKGFKELNPKIGAIYGDSINLKRQGDILSLLARSGFASSNIVLGAGSYTFQFSVSRDTHGMAMKATSATINGKRIDIYKEPKTDGGTKKSAKGLLMISNVGGKYELRDQVTEREEKHGCLEVVFEDGKLISEVTHARVKARVIEDLVKELE